MTFARSSSALALDEPDIHVYGTAEEFPIGIPTLVPSGDPIEEYRIASGFYSTGDSATWTLSPENVRRLFAAYSLGESLPLAKLFEILTLERSATFTHPRQDDMSCRLLARIRSRRRLILSQKGTLAESYPLIREDRDR